MGWLPCCCSSRVVGSAMMLRVLVISLVCIAPGFSSAAQVRMNPPPGVFKPAGVNSNGSVTGTFYSSGNAVFSGQTVNGVFSTVVGNLPVPFSASMALKSNALNVAKLALRATPGIAGAAVAAWLLNEGLQLINGQWKRVQDAGLIDSEYEYQPIAYPEAGWLPSKDAVCQVYIAHSPYCGSVPMGYTIDGNNCALGPKWGPAFCSGYGGMNVRKRESPVPVGTPEPATDEDWDKIKGPLPDNVSDELTKNVPLPLENPKFDDPYKDVPLSDPRVDPKTGEKVQDKARVTPNKNGETADVQPFTQPLNPDDTPKKDPVTDKPVTPETKEPDFCLLHPDSLACMEAGDADDSDLQKKEAGSSISPVPVGGAGFCPSPKNIPLPGGGQTQFSYQPICDMAVMVKPLLLSIAWLIAGYILIGALRNE